MYSITITIVETVYKVVEGKAPLYLSLTVEENGKGTTGIDAHPVFHGSCYEYSSIAGNLDVAGDVFSGFA